MTRTTTYLAFALVSLNIACGGGASGTGQPAPDFGNDAGMVIGNDAGAPGKDGRAMPDTEAPSIQSRFVGTWSGSIRTFFTENKCACEIRLELRDDGTCDLTNLDWMLTEPEVELGWRWSASGNPTGPTFADPWVLTVWLPGGEHFENIPLEVVLFDDDSFTVFQRHYDGDEMHVLTRVE